MLGMDRKKLKMGDSRGSVPTALDNLESLCTAALAIERDKCGATQVSSSWLALL